MVVHIDEATTEVAVISSGSIVYSQSVRVGSDKMDEAIAAHMKRAHDLTINEQTAGRVRMTIGGAVAFDPRLSMEVNGWNMAADTPSAAVVNSDEIRAALSETMSAVVEAVLIALERTPHELAADIVDKGIVLTGGDLLTNLDVLLREQTGLAVRTNVR
jgi:rod shape-determining protein MreB